MRWCLCTLLLSAFPTSLVLPSFAELSVWVFSLPGCYNYLYRMKALDAIRTSGKGAQGRSGRDRLEIDRVWRK